MLMIRPMSSVLYSWTVPEDSTISPLLSKINLVTILWDSGQTERKGSSSYVLGLPVLKFWCIDYLFMSWSLIFRHKIRVGMVQDEGSVIQRK